MKGKKITGKLHLWLGLASGLVVFILGITGCLYAFIDEIKPIVYKQKWYVQPEGQPLPVTQLLQTAQQALGSDHPVTRFEIPSDAGQSYRFYAFKNDPKAWNYFDEVKYSYVVFMNPYTGQVIAVDDYKYEFFRLVLNLHYDLFLADTGKLIVGISTIVFIVLLITGLILWWPKNKSAAKQRFWFKWKDSTKWKRKNYDLHNILGFYSMILALLIALTGLVWAFQWFDGSVQFIANGGKLPERPKPVFSDSTLNDTTSFARLDRIVSDAQASATEAGMFFVSLPRDRKSTIGLFITGKGRKRYNGSFSQYDQHTGQLLHARRFETATVGEQLRVMNYDIHVGSILGLPGKILAFFASFVAAGLPVTGFYIWWGRKNKKTAPDKKKEKKNKKKNNPSARNPVHRVQALPPEEAVSA